MPAELASTDPYVFQRRMLAVISAACFVTAAALWIGRPDAEAWKAALKFGLLFGAVFLAVPRGGDSFSWTRLGVAVMLLLFIVRIPGPLRFVVLCLAPVLVLLAWPWKRAPKKKRSPHA